MLRVLKSDDEIFYNNLPESERDKLDEKYNCFICSEKIKNEKPLFCYICQKIFHNNCLKNWGIKKNLQNEELNCPDCRNKLSFEQFSIIDLIDTFIYFIYALSQI